jgi:hypothetical protein
MLPGAERSARLYHHQLTVTALSTCCYAYSFRTRPRTQLPKAIEYVRITKRLLALYAIHFFAGQKNVCGGICRCLLPLVRAPGIGAEILFYRVAVKKIGADSPAPALCAGEAPKTRG